MRVAIPSLLGLQVPAVDQAKRERIVAARLALMRRFAERMQATPALSDKQPLAAEAGPGGLNRHGMPQVPVGQVQTHKWPVLDLGTTPAVSATDWRLTVDGACEHPQTFTLEELKSLGEVEDTSDFHCVTTWSRLDLQWRGVLASTVLAAAQPSMRAVSVMCHAYDDYTTNVRLEEVLKPDVLLAYGVDGTPLPREHGGPVRMITPQLYAWKGAKWIKRIEILELDRPGFWEQRGYSNTAHPWRNDRYS